SDDNRRPCLVIPAETGTLALRYLTSGLGFSETQRARANILPVPEACITRAIRPLSVGYLRKSGRRDHPSRRTHRHVDRSPSTCSQQDFGANRSELEARLAAPRIHSTFPSRFLLREVLPTCAGSWVRTHSHAPSKPCACPTKVRVPRHAHRPGQPTCRRSGRPPLDVIRASPRRSSGYSPVGGHNICQRRLRFLPGPGSRTLRD